MSNASFFGGGSNIKTKTYGGDITYLNTKKRLKTSSIIFPNKAIFTGNVLHPSPISTLPDTTVKDFIFYINGEYVPSSLITMTETTLEVIFIFDTSLLGYVLEEDDEIIAIGKFK